MQYNKYLFAVFTLCLSGCGLDAKSGSKTALNKRTSNPVKQDDIIQKTAKTVEKTSEGCKTPSSTTVNFAKDVFPLLEKKCIGCHTKTPPLLTTEAEATAQAPALLASVNSGKMPPGTKLDLAEIAVLKNWAEKPAFKLAAAPTPTWYQDVMPMTLGKCAYCHAAAAKNPVRPYLNTYDSVKANANKMVATMNGQGDAMPPANATPKLSATDLPAFQSWIAAGFPLGSPPPTFDLSKPVYYTNGTDALLAPCVVCHKSGAQAPDLSTFEAAKAAGPLSLADIQSGKMPPSGTLNANSIAGFKAWADGGYLLNASSTPSAPKSPQPVDPTKGTYYNDNIKNLLTTHCVSCHKPGLQAPDLSTYAMAKVAGPLSLADIERGSMPPSKALTTQDKALFKAWADGGYLEMSSGPDQPSTAPTSPSVPPAIGDSPSPTTAKNPTQPAPDPCQ